MKLLEKIPFFRKNSNSVGNTDLNIGEDKVSYNDKLMLINTENFREEQKRKKEKSQKIEENKNNSRNNESKKEELTSILLHTFSSILEYYIEKYNSEHSNISLDKELKNFPEYFARCGVRTKLNESKIIIYNIGFKFERLSEGIEILAQNFSSNNSEKETGSFKEVQKVRFKLKIIYDKVSRKIKNIENYSYYAKEISFYDLRLNKSEDFDTVNKSCMKFFETIFSDNSLLPKNNKTLNTI